MVNVVMNKNKMILQYCPNFYRIINFDFEDDSLTDKLISVYRRFIFSIDIKDMKEVKTANQIDKILAKYIEDCQFRKEFKDGLMHFKISNSSSNILKSMFIFSSFRDINSSIKVRIPS